MSAPTFLVNNYFNPRLYPGHVMTPSQEAAGAEWWHVADGRRTVALSKWTGTTTNVEYTLKVDCATAKDATEVFIGRGHNLDGKTIFVEGSTNDFSSDTDLFTMALPSTVVADSDVDDGIKTWEGAFFRRWATQSFRYWRLRIPAMGAGLKPSIPELYLGPAWEPGHLALPLQDERHVLRGEQIELPSGYVGRNMAPQRREGTLIIRLKSLAAYTAAKENAQDLFGAGRPMVMCHNDEKAERTLLGILPTGGAVDFRFPVGYGFRRADIPWLEHEPAWP